MTQSLRSPFAVALALSATGCTSSITTVRGTYASMMQCPVEQVFAREADGYYAVDGCGRHARCSEPEGPCKEVFTDVQRLELARRQRVQRRLPAGFAGLPAGRRGPPGTLSRQAARA